MDHYEISGTFIEACDCMLICPCWLDDEPDEDHCTGLFAWHIHAGTINGKAVAGRRVVSVSTHSGGRRSGGTRTALFVDDGATDEQFTLLTAAFSGALGGPLNALATVTGAVLQREKATIEVVAVGMGWKITVRPVPPGPGPVPEHLVRVSAEPRSFDDRGRPLTLHDTALHKELQVPDNGAVTAHLGEDFSVHVPVLPGGFTDLKGRSGMTGKFRYREPDKAPLGREILR
jgi:Protein of unknown function (DUF1326)